MMVGIPQSDDNTTSFDVFLGAVSFFQDGSDINILKEELGNLRKAKELLHTIIQTTQDAIFIADEAGKVVLVNLAYTKLAGLAEEQLLNQPVTVDIAEGFESVSLKVLATGKPIREAPMRIGPTRKEVIISVAPLIINGEIKGCIGVLHDVSVILRLSEELRNANKLIMHFGSKYSFQDIVGTSAKMLESKNKALIASKTDITILLRGESGTGKELFAHAIHHASSRRNKPFVRVNCAAIPESLIESELFGYSEGSFSGAKRGGRSGYFEEASGGTLFLDEIGEMPLFLQAKMLRAVQEKEIVRLGENNPRVIDVRIIAATNANLEEMIQIKLFREDLYYRLSVLPINIPSLKEIKDDIPEIARMLLTKICKEYGRVISDIDQPALEYLKSHSWAGNIRELENVLRRACINLPLQDTLMRLEHISPMTDIDLTVGIEHLLTSCDTAGSYEQLKAAWEEELITRILALNGGNRTKTASALGISLRNLYKKIAKYHLSNSEKY